MAVDKSKANAYIWFSGATDVTGNKLKDALGIDGGRKKPANGKYDVVIGWGAKTKETVNLGKAKTLNHPDKIRVNRNKLEALKLMLAGKVSVAPFCEGTGGIGNTVKLPVIGRTKYHQGGKGFWTCPTNTHVQAAAKEGAQYFQELIEIDKEYRLHVVCGKVIYAVRKARRTVEEMEAAYIKHEMDRQKSLATKNGDAFDEKTAELFLRRQAKKFAQDGANQLIRSNRLGWKFVHVTKYDKTMEKEAIKACKAIGLDFGAVDCCVDASGKAYIIEVNTGPGLEETPFKAWVATLEEELAPKTMVEKLTGKMSAKKKEPAPLTKAAATPGTMKERLLGKLSLASEMAEKTESEEEAEVLNKVFARMFNE